MELAHQVPIKTNPARGPLFCPEFDSPEEEEGFEPQSPQDVRPFRDSPFRSCDPELIATRGPTLVVVSLDVLELLFQLREAIADLAAIEIETGLARAGALLPPAARRGLPQARRDVPQPRDLHLQLRLAAVGMTMEDLHITLVRSSTCAPVARSKLRAWLGEIS